MSAPLRDRVVLIYPSASASVMTEMTTMTTHTHPEIASQIEQVNKDLSSETGCSEDRVLAALANVKTELKGDIAEVKSDIAEVKSDIASIAKSLGVILPPKDGDNGD